MRNRPPAIPRTRLPASRPRALPRERPDRLRRCLDAILASEYPADRVSLVVVDNAPATEATHRLVKGYEDRANIRYFREDARGSASARNRGIREVHTEVLAMTDDDTIVDRHWLAEVARTFDAFPAAAVVSGLLVPMELDTPAQLWFEQWGGFSRGFDRRVFDLAANRPANEPLYPSAAEYLEPGTILLSARRPSAKSEALIPLLATAHPLWEELTRRSCCGLS